MCITLGSKMDLVKFLCHYFQILAHGSRFALVVCRYSAEPTVETTFDIGVIEPTFGVSREPLLNDRFRYPTIMIIRLIKQHDEILPVTPVTYSVNKRT